MIFKNTAIVVALIMGLSCCGKKEAGGITPKIEDFSTIETKNIDLNIRKIANKPGNSTYRKKGVLIVGSVYNSKGEFMETFYDKNKNSWEMQKNTKEDFLIMSIPLQNIITKREKKKIHQ